jgi:hypothetical protein
MDRRDAAARARAPAAAKVNRRSRRLQLQRPRLRPFRFVRQKCDFYFEGLKTKMWSSSLPSMSPIAEPLASLSTHSLSPLASPSTHSLHPRPTEPSQASRTLLGHEFDDPTSNDPKSIDAGAGWLRRRLGPRRDSLERPPRPGHALRGIGPKGDRSARERAKFSASQSESSGLQAVDLEKDPGRRLASRSHPGARTVRYNVGHGYHKIRRDQQG